MFRRLLIYLAGLVLIWAPGERLMAQNGIFADFTTSKGNFTCQLDFTNAPKTVANFVGLATGQRPWLDLVTGRARTDPFYNGLTFHRVIANFMNQGGSPNGTGSDGPGYAFVDEFSSRLVFTNSGVMAMANSGPNSDGSQFFITVAPYTSGNYIYSIFGHVVSGMNVISNINKVATDSNNKPLTNVVIQQVNIRRVGTQALAFDINAHGLPVVTNPPLQVTHGTSQATVGFSNRLYADNRLYSVTNLGAPWSSTSMGIEITAPTTNSTQSAIDTPNKFFRLAQIQYASSTFAPKNVLGRTLRINFSGGGGSLTNVFNVTGRGTYTYSGPPQSSGTITNYTWSQEPYRGFLWPIYYSGLNPMTLQLNFTNGANGTLNGTVYGTFPSSISGSFTLSP